jgi:hypothetical protein
MSAMPNDARDYWGLYLDGRGQPRPRGLQIDIAKLVEAIVAGEVCVSPRVVDQDFHGIVRTACATAFAERSTDRQKREWFDDNEEIITELKLDKERAHAAWMAGRIDELTGHIEVEVLDEMETILDNEE